MKVEKSSIANYLNWDTSSPNASTIKDISILQGPVSPLYDAPIVVEATPLKTTPLNSTKV